VLLSNKKISVILKNVVNYINKWKVFSMFSLKKLLIFLFVFISSATLYPQEFIQGEIVDHYGSFYTVAYSRVIKKKNMVHEIAQLKNE
jgi:hypothetical protein